MGPGDVGDKAERFVDPTRINLGLSSREFLEMALWLEKAGIEFYRLLSEEAKEESLRIFFLRLIGMELDHQRLIQDMLTAEPLIEAKKAGFDETLTHREFFVHLRGMLQKKVFPQSLEFLTELDRYKSPRDALDQALAIETESIKLYKNLAEFKLPYKSQSTIAKLIAEEESHIEEINKIIESMGG
ncbi:MAG TPA: ferritin family protein [bacterium]|nr:ferritin family protein [bacterium]